MKTLQERIAANQYLKVRTGVNVSRPAQSSVNRPSRQLNLSPALQQKVFELHQQIRQELGDVKYALLGKGQAAVLMGVENDELNTLCPDMMLVPNIPNRQALQTPTTRNMGFLRG